MSQKYPGGFITKTPTAPTASAAPGIWTLDQAMQNQKAGNWPSPPSPYIEDWFSTYLYTGNSSTQTITNGINLSANGGMVWGKSRTAASGHNLYDTVRGASLRLAPNVTNAQANTSPAFSSFNSNGFSLNGASDLNNSGDSIVSWTFAERQKFFDVVTYTGDGTIRAISHNLGAVPGCMIVKRLNVANDWAVYHRATSATPWEDVGFLNSTSAWYIGFDYGDPFWGNTAPTSTNFTVNTALNASGDTYVAYLFAHDAGGFGLSGSDNVISCGSFTLDGSNTAIVTLGYEPQWVMIKRTNSTGNWAILDNMRGLTTSGIDAALRPNTASAETNGQEGIYPTATGFGANTGLSSSGDSYIYIAIRRGPMKVPTLGTTVYNAIARSGTGAAATVTGVGFPPDSVWPCVRNNPGNGTFIYDRLRGANASLNTPSTGAENTGTITALTAFGMDGFTLGSNNIVNESGSTFINWCFQRAPGFFDEVCYTGNGTAGLSVSHNLTVPPEMVIVKRRNSTGDWPVLMRNVDRLGSAGSSYRVNSTASWDPAGVYFSDSSGTFVPATDATSTVFKVSNATAVNASAGTYVAYLFATCAGVSKVGSYTGTGTTLQVNCGFTAGSRFVLIKRADASGDWYVWDSARGIVAGNDPYLLLNSTAAEVTGTDYVDTYNAGFELSSTAPAALNANGGTYIFLAIA